jgi:hypothetical protein
VGCQIKSRARGVWAPWERANPLSSPTERVPRVSGRVNECIVCSSSRVVCTGGNPYLSMVSDYRVRSG